MPTIAGSSVWADLNGWRVQTNVWNAGGLVYGQDYTIAATYNAGNFANRPQYTWTFPALTQTNYYNVHAYPEIMFGGSPWWDGALSSDPLQIFPIRVSDLAELTLKYDLSATGNSQGYNIAFELFLTSQPNGNSSTITNEVMVWFHRGAFNPGGSATGTYSDTNFTGTIYNAYNWNAGTGAPGWTYTAFLSSVDDLSGQINIAAMLHQLQTMGIISPNNFIAGLELGAEVATGQGSLTVNSLEYDVRTNNGINTVLGTSNGTANADRIIGSADDDTLNGLAGSDILYGFAGNDALNGGEEQDSLIGGAGNDTLDGGSNIDTAVAAGSRSAYTITQTSTGNFTVSGPDGNDALTNIEYLKFDDQTMRLLPGTGSTVTWSADPSTYMPAIRDFDGNDLGGASSWKLIGTADVNGDGRAEHILFNRQIGRWAEVGSEADGLTYFSNYNWAGDTRVVGIYIDPLVANGTVVKDSDFDSQRRFQNDLMIDNIHGVLGQADYDHDGLQEVYFSLTDGTAYLHAYMHADGNIQYANYQNKQQVIDYLTSNGFTSSTWSTWFPGSQAAMEVSSPDPLIAAVDTTIAAGLPAATSLWSLPS